MLFDINSEFNVIYLTFVKKPDLFIKPIDIRALKIDSIMLNTYKIVVVDFLILNKVNKIKFFKKPFLMTNVILEVIFRVFFLTLSIADINFLE